MVTYIIYINEKQQNSKPQKNNYLQALPRDEHMNTGRNSKQTTCLCRDTGEKGTLPTDYLCLKSSDTVAYTGRTLPAQRTGFNTLDNWGHKTPTQSKRTGKKRAGAGIAQWLERRTRD